MPTPRPGSHVSGGECFRSPEAETPFRRAVSRVRRRPVSSPSVKRLQVIAIFAASLVAVAAPVVPAAAQASLLAQSDDAPSDGGPAVVIEDEKAEVEEEAWTFRYLVPTVLAIGAVTIIIMLLMYGLRVRGRYRVAR